MDSNRPPVSPEPAPAVKPRNGWMTALMAASAVVVIGAGAGAFALGSSLSGGGAQPEDVLASGALAFAKLDLDPAANQKLAVYQLSKKFPDLLTDAGSDRALDSVVAGVLADAPGGISYETDIKPWLGDRVGIAVYPPAKAGDAPRVALAAQVDDEAKMQAALKKDTAAKDLDWTTRDGFVVMTDQEADDFTATGADESLAAQPNFAADVAALDGSQVAVGWADLGRIGDAMAAAAKADFASFGEPTPEDLLGFPPELAAEMQAEMQKEIAQLRKQMDELQKQMDEQVKAMAEMSGRLAVGVHATGDFLEVQGRTFDMSGTDQWTSGVAGTNLAGRMPADSLGVVSGTGIADSAAEQWKSVAALPMMGFGNMAKQYGLKLPADFVALFGDETAAALGSVAGGPGARPELTLRTRGGDMVRARAIATLLTDALHLPAPTARKVADGFVLGNSTTAVQAAADGTDTLADTEEFARAVPDAEGASMVVYADIAKILQAAGDAAEAKKYEGLDAVGFSMTAADNPTFRLRLTAD